ncbi:MAG: kelch repeat-containing protein, partial [Anaerolineae bacterium]
MKRTHGRNITFVLLGALLLALAIYPPSAASGQEFGLKNAWERVQEAVGSPSVESGLPAGIMGLLPDRSQPDSVREQLEEARQRALDAGSYHYDAEVRQTLIPRPLPEMIGRSDERVNWQAQGDVRLPDQSSITIWFDGAEPLTLIRDGQQTFLRQGDTVKEVQDPTQLATPSADYLAYLDAAKNVRRLEPKQAGGRVYAGYAFEIDGPRFAEQVRQQLERELAGEMPPGGQVTAPRILQLMTGTGELWVDEAGLPRRQVLDLLFPEATEAYDARVHMVTDFRDYGQPQAVPTVVQGQGGIWQVRENQPSPAIEPVSSLVPVMALRIAPSDVALFLLCLLFVLGVLCLRRCRRQTIYAVVAVVAVLVMVGNPLLESLDWVRFQERQAQAASVETLAGALGLEVAGPSRPLAASQPALAPAVTLHTTSSADGPSPQCGDGSPDVDTDGDGLSDYVEGCYGTDSLNVDTDGDSISDALEVQGVDEDKVAGAASWDEKHRTSNALKADSNRDGLPDGVEWPAPDGEAPGWDPDGDGIPNTWDDDNDGDGVPDGEDLSPFAVGDYSSSLSIVVADANRQGYQYIEFQLQPKEDEHLRYTTTWLDWPDDDVEGTITSPITGTEDLRLLPFLEVETRAIPGEALRSHYGLVLKEEAGEIPHLLIPLYAQGSGGAVTSLSGKVVYGPGAQDDDPAAQNGDLCAQECDPGAQEVVHWANARLVWLVQAKDKDGNTSPAHVYVEDYRLTGMQVTKSDGYELGLFGTPSSVLEDKDLFQILFGMSATFLEYEELENQTAGTALLEVERRFDEPDTEPGYRWGVTQTVASSVKTYSHQDEALAVSSDQVKEFLDVYFARTTDLCRDAGGEEFECAGVVVGTEERLRAVPVEDLGGSTIWVPMTGVATFTTRGLRYQMYQRTGSSWKTVGIARTLEIVEKRYAGEWDAILAGYQSDYPNLVEGDLRFATHLAYQSWAVGRQRLVKVGDYSLVPLPDKPEIIALQALGLAEAASGVLIQQVMHAYDLAKEFNAARGSAQRKLAKPIFKLEGNAIIDAERAKIVRNLQIKGKAARVRGISAASASVAATSASIAGVVCASAGGCNEEALKWTSGGFTAVELAFEVVDLVGRISTAVTQGVKGMTSTLASMSKSAKALAVVGLVIEVGLIWAGFFVSIGQSGWKTSGFVFDQSLGNAIVATIVAVALFVVMLLATPGVNIVIGVVLVVLALVDLILSLVGVNFSVMGTILSVFYRAEMVNEVESALYLGKPRSGQALADLELGYVVGNTFELWDTFQAVITGSTQADRASAKATWTGKSTTDVEAEDANGSVTALSSTSTRREVENKVGVGFELKTARPNVLLTVDTSVHFSLRYKNCIFWGICWYKTDESDSPASDEDPTTFEVVLDVLPASVAGLWEWTEIGNPDPDGDGLTAAAEEVAGTAADKWDSDGDGLSDKYEWDNRAELGTDPAIADRDGDGLSDGLEVLWGTAPGDADSDGDGLADGEEIAGWAVRLPDESTYWTFSDPSQKDADGDGLTDKMEKDNQTSPYAANDAPLLLAATEPLSVVPGGRLATTLEPREPVTITLGLLNTASTAITSTLQVCFDGPLDNTEVITIGVPGGTPPPPTDSHDCGSGMAGYAWNFGGPYALPVGHTFLITATATAARSSGTGRMTYSMPYRALLLEGLAEVKVESDYPTAALLSPADGEILTGKNYVLGGSALSPASRIEQVELSIVEDPGLAFSNGSSIPITATLGAWAYTWNLPADGRYTVAVVAQDTSGRQSEPVQVGVVVDNTPPAVTLDPPEREPVGPVHGQITVTGQAQDNLTGLSRVQVSVDGGPWQDAALEPSPDPEAGSYPLDATWHYSWTVSAAAQGRHTVAARALDRAGLLGDEEQGELTLDAVPPSSDLRPQLDEETPVVAADTGVTLTGYASDAGNVPLPPQPAALKGTLDAIADATVWLWPGSIHEDGASVTLHWVGDMDGDWLADLAMGFPAGENGNGRIVVLYGRPGDWRQPPEAESLAGEWTSFVGAEGAGLGAQFAPSGDVDGDGLDDLLVGDPANKRAFLIFGKPYPLGAVLMPDRPLDGPASGWHTVFTLADNQPFGEFVAPAGDVNGDGYADLLIGSPGQAYLILGHGVPWLASADAGEEAAAVFDLPEDGRTVGVGDVNGDKYDDWVVTDPAGGGLRLMSGSRSFFPAQLRMDVGDVDGDQHDDWLVPDPAGGEPRLVSGAQAAPRQLAFLPGDGPGSTEVVALGDVNGDGLGDFIYSTGSAPRLVLGREDGDWDVSHEFSSYDPPLNGFLAAPGDVNADGMADLLLGTGDNRAYLILGRADWDAQSGVEATFVGVAGAASAPLAGGADLNGDGSSDLLLLPGPPGTTYWHHTSSMAADRSDHTATLLPSGNVLVAGGFAAGALASTELYDPETESWSASGIMSTARYRHTATLLPDGNVLVAGGWSPEGVLASAELYDPEAGTWSPTGDTVTARADHSATLLSNGKALVVGGWGPDGILAGAELYDAKTGTWTPVAPMSMGRRFHTATLLADGNVLVVGGWQPDGILDSAELYDPETDTWAPVAPLSIGRWGHTATLLPDGQVLVAGGWHPDGILSSAELYDPETDTWNPVAPMSVGRWRHTATLLPDGNVLVAGGWHPGGILTGAELYDPATETWTPAAPIVVGRRSHTATLLPDGTVLAAGGIRASALASAELYDLLPTDASALLFGRQGISRAEAYSGVDGVDVALVSVPDGDLPPGETLPTAWVPATLQTPQQVASGWFVAIQPQQDGLHRIYTRATDQVGNQETDPADWYSGAVLVDGTPPAVSWLEPPQDLITDQIAPLVQATAADWLDMGGRRSFAVAEVRFEANGEVYPAVWAEDGWKPEGGQPRTFEAIIPLWEGSNRISAVATDLAGHEARSIVDVTSSTPGDAAAITSIRAGSATNESGLVISGYARYVAGSGAGRVLVAVDGGAPLEAMLEDPGAARSTWSVPVTLAGEGPHTITATAARDESAQLVGANSATVTLDQTQPDLSVRAPGEGKPVRQTFTLEGKATDALSGIGRVEVSLDGGIGWSAAELSGEDWSFTSTVPGAGPGVTTEAWIRATDRAGNVATQTRRFIVDGELPQGIEPLTFNIPVSTQLSRVQTLEASWTPAVDGNGPVTVTAVIDQIRPTDALTSCPAYSPEVTGLSLAESLDADGAWYFHLSARDAAGNCLIYHEGPWQVDLIDTSVTCDRPQKFVRLDGHLDLAAGEWLTASERLDDDERPDSVQSLYATWDADYLYLGWDGAQWDMDGTLWAYLDTGPGGSNVSREGDHILPFDADLALKVDGSSDFNYSRGVMAAEKMDLFVSDSGKPRKVASITCEPSGVYAARRNQGFEAKMKELGYEVVVAPSGNSRPEDGYEAMQSILSDNPDVAGVFACNDLVAGGAAEAVADAGKNSSTDILVTGFTDDEIALEAINTGTMAGTLWRDTSPEPLEFVAGGNQTEIRVRWDNLASTSQLRLLVYAVDDNGQVWSVFPTTNPLSRPWSQAYVWDNPCATTDPSSGQPRGTSVDVTLSSRQSPNTAWGPNSKLEYVVDLTNREARTLTGLQLTLKASEGLSYLGDNCEDGDTCRFDIPELELGASHRVTVTGLLDQRLGELRSVTSTATLEQDGAVVDKASLTHRVDGQPPTVHPNRPPGNAVGRGLQTISGTADDGDGSGVRAITMVDPAIGVVGTLVWKAEVDFPNIEDGTVQPYTVTVGACDLACNVSEP